MFTTERVPAFIQAVSIQGKADAQMLRITVYVTPATPELAAEVSPLVARTLFQKSQIDDNLVPVLGLGPVPFALGNIPMQSIEWFAAADDSIPHDGTLMEKAQISRVRSAHPYANRPEITSIIFDVDVPIDKSALELAAIRFFKNKVFITTRPLQASLFEEPTREEELANAVCERCNEPASWIDSTGTFLCNDDVRMGVGETKRIRPVETPKEAEQRVLTEAEKKLETPIPEGTPAATTRPVRRGHFSRVR